MRQMYACRKPQPNGQCLWCESSWDILTTWLIQSSPLPPLSSQLGIHHNLSQSKPAPLSVTAFTSLCCVPAEKKVLLPDLKLQMALGWSWVNAQCLYRPVTTGKFIGFPNKLDWLIFLKQSMGADVGKNSEVTKMVKAETCFCISLKLHPHRTKLNTDIFRESAMTKLPEVRKEL